MIGYFSANALKLHEAIVTPGTWILLENIAIFVNKSHPVERYLNIHENCVKAVFVNNP